MAFVLFLLGDRDFFIGATNWDRKGKNEIDLVCENEFKGTLDFYEVKRDAKRFDRHALEAKVEAFFHKNPEKRNRVVSLAGLSLADV